LPTCERRGSSLRADGRPCLGRARPQRRRCFGVQRYHHSALLAIVHGNLSTQESGRQLSRPLLFLLLHLFISPVSIRLLYHSSPSCVCASVFSSYPHLLLLCVHRSASHLAGGNGWITRLIKLTNRNSGSDMEEAAEEEIRCVYHGSVGTVLNGCDCS